MKYRKLRIAWSVAWCVVAVLLCVLWVRSYSDFDSLGNGKHGLTSINGWLYIDETFKIECGDDKILWWDSASPHYFLVRRQNAAVGSSGIGWRLPYWLVLVPCLSICISPSLPWWSARFSLRTLLIATTLLAIVLGLIVWSTR
jgi:hypothetical protein